MVKDLDLEELFRRVSRPGETFDDEWCEEVQELMWEEAEVVGQRDWDSGGPGGGAGSVNVRLFRGVFIGDDDENCFGPYDTFDEAADAIALFFETSATTGIWVDPRFAQAISDC